LRRERRKERNGVRDEETKEIIFRWILTGLSFMILPWMLVMWYGQMVYIYLYLNICIDFAGIFMLPFKTSMFPVFKNKYRNVRTFITDRRINDTKLQAAGFQLLLRCRLNSMFLCAPVRAHLRQAGSSIQLDWTGSPTVLRREPLCHLITCQSTQWVSGENTAILDKKERNFCSLLKCLGFLSVQSRVLA
jgi:hypothetical protein